MPAFSWTDNLSERQRDNYVYATFGDKEYFPIKSFFEEFMQNNAGPYNLNPQVISHFYHRFHSRKDYLESLDVYVFRHMKRLSTRNSHVFEPRIIKLWERLVDDFCLPYAIVIPSNVSKEIDRIIENIDDNTNYAWTLSGCFKFRPERTALYISNENIAAMLCISHGFIRLPKISTKLDYKH